MTGTQSVAVVTGGSRGIGRAIVERLHADGFAVLLTHSRSPAEADDVIAALDGGPAISALQVDITDHDAPARIVESSRELGTVRALVNNAAITGTLGPLTALGDADLRRLIEVDLEAPIRLTREAIRRHDGGPLSIVTISSNAARSGSPGEYVVYASIKAALETFTVGVAKEVAASGIRVNAVAPGFVDTTIHARAGEPGRAHRLGATTPMGRPGTADEIAAAVAWLISDEAGYVTGETIRVTGGT
jgi:NAD(P)-dependent dehydrogenase (short-subunit alcohol dehydrogenase family)